MPPYANNVKHISFFISCLGAVPDWQFEQVAFWSRVPPSRDPPLPSPGGA